MITMPDGSAETYATNAARSQTDILWIVIPTYNEAANLTRLVPALEAVCAGRACEILIVDDASPDETERVVDELRTRYGNVTLHRRCGARGLGSALREGLSLALADPQCKLICTLDADFSHDPLELPTLLAAAERAAFVQGSRYIEGGCILDWSWHRRVLSWGINRMCRLLGGRLQEHTTNYRVYNREAATAAVKITGSGGFEWIILASLAIQATALAIVEVPITFKEREIGVSKLSPVALSRYGPFVMGLMIGRIASRLPKLQERQAARALQDSTAVPETVADPSPALSQTGVKSA